MIREIWNIFRGRRLWARLRSRYQIKYDCAVLILPERNPEWNREILRCLPAYIARKQVPRGLVLTTNPDSGACAREFACDNITHGHISEKDVRLLVQYYSLKRFYDYILFFYFHVPRDNLSGEILSYGDISMKELICYGFYKLREVPAHV